MRLLGKIFDHQGRAEEIITEQLRQLALIKEKIAHIPFDKRLRVVRLMELDNASSLPAWLGGCGCGEKQPNHLLSLRSDLQGRNPYR